MDFKRKSDFFENLSNDEKLEILFEDRKNMFRYVPKSSVLNKGWFKYGLLRGGF